MATNRTTQLRKPPGPPTTRGRPQEPEISRTKPVLPPPFHPDISGFSLEERLKRPLEQPLVPFTPRRLPAAPPGFTYAYEKAPPGVPGVERRLKLVPAKASEGLQGALTAVRKRLESGQPVEPNGVRRLLSLVAGEGTPRQTVDQLRTLVEQHAKAFAPEARSILTAFVEKGGERPTEGAAVWDLPEDAGDIVEAPAFAERVAVAGAAVTATSGTGTPQSGAGSTEAANAVEAASSVEATPRAGASRFVPGHAWRGGMGAIPHDGGTTFRLWAPNARRVQVIGDFNGWNLWDAKELWRDDGGNWSGFVPDAHHGQRYKYVIEGKYGDWRWRNDPRAAQVTNSTGDSVIYSHEAYFWKHSWDFKMPAFNDLVIYEMHVGTFHDSPGWGPGTWNSAIDKLDYLEWLGVSAVKVMPIAEFPGDFSKGYNPAYPFAPESAYGHPDDVKRFVDECHKRNIAVIVDVVYNHWGPNDLPHWDLDGESWGHGGEYFYNDHRANTPWGATRPNYGRHEVREYIKDMKMTWMRDYRMDGVRDDAIFAVRNAQGSVLPEGWSLTRESNDKIKQEFPWKITIAEDMQAEPAITHPLGANFDSQWCREFVHNVRGTIAAGDDQSRDMYRLARAIGHVYNGNAFERVTFTESHDEVSHMNGKQRLPSLIGGWDTEGKNARRLSAIAMGLTMTAPGIPMFFQGQEFLESEQFRDDQPIDWSNRPVKFDGFKRMTRDLVQLRRNWHNTTQGLKGNNLNIHHINNNEKVIGFHRWDQGGSGDDCIVIANTSDRTFHGYRLGLPSDGTWKVRFNSDAKVYAEDFGSVDVPDVHASWDGQDGMPASGMVNLPPQSILILSKDR